MTASANRWTLQDAKARFSEVVRHAREGEPQHVSVHGQDAVVVVSANRYRTLAATPSGLDIVRALGSTDWSDVETGRVSFPSRVRDVEL